jgi:hypothetical protein
MGFRNIMFLVIAAGYLALAYTASASDVDRLLRLEEYRRGEPSADWPEPGTVSAYA